MNNDIRFSVETSVSSTERLYLVWSSVSNSVENSVKDSLWEFVRVSINSPIWSSVRISVRNPPRDAARDYFEQNEQ